MTELELREADGDTILSEFLDQKEMYHFEGDSGVENLNKVCSAIGYRAHGFRYGTSLEVFLSDNPGAQQAILDWIGQHIGIASEWSENLSNEIELEDVEEDEEEKEEEDMMKRDDPY